MGAVLLVAHSSVPNPGQRKEGGVGLPCAPFAEATAASNDSSPVDGAGRRDGVFADGGRLVRRRSLREAVGEEKPSSGIIKLGAGSGWAQDLLGPRAGRSSTGRVMTERIQECRAPRRDGVECGRGSRSAFEERGAEAKEEPVLEDSTRQLAPTSARPETVAICLFSRPYNYSPNAIIVHSDPAPVGPPGPPGSQTSSRHRRRSSCRAAARSQSGPASAAARRRANTSSVPVMYSSLYDGSVTRIAMSVSANTRPASSSCSDLPMIVISSRPCVPFPGRKFGEISHLFRNTRGPPSLSRGAYSVRCLSTYEFTYSRHRLVPPFPSTLASSEPMSWTCSVCVARTYRGRPSLPMSANLRSYSPNECGIGGRPG